LTERTLSQLPYYCKILYPYVFNLFRKSFQNYLLRNPWFGNLSNRCGGLILAESGWIPLSFGGMSLKLNMGIGLYLLVAVFIFFRLEVNRPSRLILFGEGETNGFARLVELVAIRFSISRYRRISLELFITTDSLF
jgi:hypothetical protein